MQRIRVEYSRILSLLARGLIDEADKLSRSIARSVWRNVVSKMSSNRILELIDRITGGLGYKSDSPLDPLQMTVAGSYIAWPEAIRDNARVLEIGTGIGRTCYVAHYNKKIGVYVTIDISPEILAIALYGNPVRQYSECLWREDVKIILADAVEAVPLLQRGYFTHLIHDGGPNPLRAPSLYTVRFMRLLASRLAPKSTASIFAGRSRKARERVYRAMLAAGFKVVETVSLPDSPAIVYHAVVDSTSQEKRVGKKVTNKYHAAEA